MRRYCICLVSRLTCSGWSSLSQVRVGGGTASDLHSRVTCLFSSTDTSWGVLSPTMLGGTVTEHKTGQKWTSHVIIEKDKFVPINFISFHCSWGQLPSIPQYSVQCTLQIGTTLLCYPPCTRTRNSLSSSPAGLLAKQLYRPVSSNWARKRETKYENFGNRDTKLLHLQSCFFCLFFFNKSDYWISVKFNMRHGIFLQKNWPVLRLHGASLLPAGGAGCLSVAAGVHPSARSKRVWGYLRPHSEAPGHC